MSASFGSGQVTETRRADGSGHSQANHGPAPRPTAPSSAPAAMADAPLTDAEYLGRLIFAGFRRAEAAEYVAAAVASGRVAFTAADPADTAAGAGWSVMALLADGTAEPMARCETFGQAADIATDARRLSRGSFILAADGRRHTWRVVVVPTD